jgi:limonene-1,2-epoxide hydrolase
MGSGICTTATNDLVVTGSLGGTTTFEKGAPNVTILAGNSSFLAQYHANDGTLTWAEGIGGDFVPSAVAATPLGGAMVAGTLRTAATLGSGTTVVNTPYVDILLARYAADGSLAWVKRVDRGSSIGRSMSVLSDGAFLVLGNKVIP